MVAARSVRKPSSKIMSRRDAEAWRGNLSGLLVFTNGVFDLLHPGHVDVLDGARRQGDVASLLPL